MRIFNYSLMLLFFRKERNKEKAGKVQQDKTNPNTWQKWGNC